MFRLARFACIVFGLLLLSASNLFAWGGIGYYGGDLNLGGPPANATLNLSNTSMILTNSNYDKIYDYLVSGYDNGAWDGKGIVSSVAKSHPQFTLGLMTGEEFLDVNGPTFYGYQVQPSWILVDFTYFGDSNFDHVVNAFDNETAYDSYLALHDSDPYDDPPIDWAHGDYNYDGVIDHSDCSLIPVPEPSVLILLACICSLIVGLRLKR
jgi:hypothetical protein